MAPALAPAPAPMYGGPALDTKHQTPEWVEEKLVEENLAGEFQTREPRAQDVAKARDVSSVEPHATKTIVRVLWSEFFLKL